MLSIVYNTKKSCFMAVYVNIKHLNKYGKQPLYSKIYNSEGINSTVIVKRQNILLLPMLKNSKNILRKIGIIFKNLEANPKRYINNINLYFQDFPEDLI